MKQNLKQYKRILDLRRKGLSFREIARTLEKSVSTIHDQFKRAKKVAQGSK